MKHENLRAWKMAYYEEKVVSIVLLQNPEEGVVTGYARGFQVWPRYHRGGSTLYIWGSLSRLREL